MIRNNPTAWKAAIAIHAHFQSKATVAALSDLPEHTWKRSGDLLRRLRLAQQHRWHLAATRLRRDLNRSLDILSAEVSAMARPLQPEPPQTRAASLGDIYADLLALEEEFDEVSISLRDRTISAITEPIELGGVYLGRFKVQLNWSQLPGECPCDYCVKALDPNPAASDETVTHPHVQDEAVCEGDARQPIWRALEEGRLLDFFVVVASLLRTYNSDSPYVALADWHGSPCTDCGGNCYGEDRWTCEKCAETICGDCYICCPGCDSSFCIQCLTRCADCDEHHCQSCLDDCKRCDAELCQRCRDERPTCPECHAQEQESIESDDEDHDADTAGCQEDAEPAVQSHGLGKAALPA